MNARDILNLLARKHSSDIFIDECKDGPTQYGSHYRLDGWAMKRSWANPQVVGYEIKVSRSDFLQDDKWPNYLGLCNQLYFVCPTGLIEKPEIPDGVGLMWVAKTGTRLYTKLKAPYREVDIPESLWRYILMCRCVITRENAIESPRNYWEQWLIDKKLDWSFGHHVSKSIRERVKKEVEDVRDENKRLTDRMSGYDSVIRFLESIDIDPSDRWGVSEYTVRKKLEEARAVLPDGIVHDLNKLSERAAATAQKLETIAESAPDRRDSDPTGQKHG